MTDDEIEAVARALCRAAEMDGTMSEGHLLGIVEDAWRDYGLAAQVAIAALDRHRKRSTIEAAKEAASAKIKELRAKRVGLD